MSDMARHEHHPPVTPRPTRSSTWVNRIVTLAVLLTCFRVWFGNGERTHDGSSSGHAQAWAQNPPTASLPFDATAQRKEMIDLLNRINGRLDAILEILRGGVINVSVQSADKPASTSIPRRSK